MLSWELCVPLLLMSVGTIVVPTSATGSLQLNNNSCSTLECPKGSECQVFQSTGEEFCNPSCNIDNGGCDEDQLCILALPVCANPPLQPCVGFVTCIGIDPCADHECPRGSSCKMYGPTNEAYCDPSCELDNGGCETNQMCALQTVQCVRAPCPPEVVCKDAQPDCSAVLCLKPDCENPLPPPPGECCSTCPEEPDCSAVLCLKPDCENPLPPPPGECCSTCPKVDCRLVLCAAPTCPNPIPADIENGRCCPTCPKGSSCLIEGQFFQSCGSGCPPTCDNPDITCNQQCVPGCHCPTGQVIDKYGRTCFTSDECPDVNICKLPAKSGPCKGAFLRYFFNAKTGQCEKFIFGGCKGNANNFQTRYECHTACDSNIQCKDLRCPPLTCPDPILPDPDNGICCGSCPKGSTCPVKGQIYAQCKGCPATCADLDKRIFCPAVCIPGCKCPSGQVIDEETNSCVDPKDCTPTCKLSPDPGPCKAAIPRYFYNSASKQCEKFIYGGCQGNDNNFQSLLECELECSECSPTCTPEYCSAYPKAKCSLPPGTPREIPGCFGGCDETVCSACYNSSEALALPPLWPGCPTTCNVNSNGVISHYCLKKWGYCVKKACIKTYGKAVHSIAESKDLKCWRPSCPLRG